MPAAPAVTTRLIPDDNNDEDNVVEFVDYGRYGFWTALCFTINFIVGVGTLELPYSYQQSGILQGLVASLLMGTLFAIGVNYVVVASSRALALLNMMVRSNTQRTALDSSYGTVAVATKDIHDDDDDKLLPTVVAADHVERSFDRVKKSVTMELSTFVSADHSVDNAANNFTSFDLDDETNTEALKLLNDNTLFTFNELLDVFTPLPVKLLYEVLFCSLIFFALWSYTSVFGKSMVGKLPIFDWGNKCAGDDYTAGCEQSYMIYVLAYGCVVVYLTMVEFAEMALFQIALTIARFFLIFIIVMTSVLGLFFDSGDHDATTTGSPPPASASAPYLGHDVALWNWSGTSVIVAGLLFGQLISFGTPSLISPLRRRSQSSKLMVSGIILTGSLYALVSSCAVLYWGADLQSQINLTYSTYRGGASAKQKVAWWAVFVQYYVDLFPALDVLSMFPLVSITLGNSLLAFIIRISPTARRWHFAKNNNNNNNNNGVGSGGDDDDDDGSSGKKASSRWSRVSWVKVAARLMAGVPPIVGALFEKNIVKILQYASVPAIFIAFVFPALLQVYSAAACNRAQLDSRTPYCFGSYRVNQWIVGVLMVVSGFLLVLEIGQLVNPKFMT